MILFWDSLYLKPNEKYNRIFGINELLFYYATDSMHMPGHYYMMRARVIHEREKKVYSFFRTGAFYSKVKEQEQEREERLWHLKCELCE